MLKRVTSLFMAGCIVLAGIMPGSGITAKAAPAEENYTIYPKPQDITYPGGEYVLRETLNVIYDDEIDSYTKDRMEETANLKNLKIHTSDEAVSGMTNVYVGVYGSGGNAEQYITDTCQPEASLFEKTDAYFLSSDDNVISILGKDTDASFYGITTLYHVLNQMESFTIKNFTIKDYADVTTRGFIEGYYGNPWTVDDRADLMGFGGYYKLNAYFYAPKDDEKHRAKWSELYTEEELKNIKKLADAGNASKCRYIYAIHPFPHGNNFRFDTEAHYQEDLAKLKAKLKQVIDQGVRQVAILADDFYNPGGANGLRVIHDMTEWLKEVQKEYPDMKQTLPYVPFDYMGSGNTEELQILKDAPDNVQLVMTGGRVWGQVSQNFTNTFTNNVGRGPFMWINWPCTDNSKQHLIMGGNETFLQPGVDPSAIEGIMLNPMQQSEPSKAAIFANATYSWQIWDSAEEAQECWNETFHFIDHNSPIPTSGSEAYRELSKHMINQNMSSATVVPLQESVDLAPKLNAFKQKLSNGTLSGEDISEIAKEFEILQKAATTYRSNTGNQRTRDQIVYWLDCWDDTTQAALSYLQGLQYELDGNTDGLLEAYTNGKTAFERSKTHRFWYVDHYETAEVGVQHIVPFIKAMESVLSSRVEEIGDPTKITKTYISNAFTNPSSGSIENLFDENDETTVQFMNPNFLYKDNYVGVKFNKPVKVNKIRFAFGGGKNHFYTSKLQYTTDGENWTDVNGTVYDRPRNSEDPIEETDLSLEGVLGIRLIATQDNAVNGVPQDLWLLIKSIDINKGDDVKEEETQAYQVEKTEIENAVIASGGGVIGNAVDGNVRTEVRLKDTSGDKILPNAAIVLDLGQEREIGSVFLAQDCRPGNDILDAGAVEVSTNKTDWTAFGDVSKENEQTIKGSAKARYVRIRNTQEKGVWWRIGEVQVFGPDAETPLQLTATGVETAIGKHASINDGAKNNKFDYIVDGDDATLAWLAGSENGNILADTGVQIMFNRDAVMDRIRIKQASEDTVGNMIVQYTADGTTWETLRTLNPAGAEVNLDAEKTAAKGIRILSAAGTGKWWQLYEVEVKEPSKGTKDYVYTNIETDILSNATNSVASLTPGSVSLAQGDYIGLKLSNIKEVISVEADDVTADGLLLQASKNELQWTDISQGAQTDMNVRFIRLYNGSKDLIEVNLEKFVVTSNEMEAESIYEIYNMPIDSNYGSDDVRNQNDAWKIFDGDISTAATIACCPPAGSYVIFDLGKTVNVESIRYYVAETALNYIRDAEFEVADQPDSENWTKVLTIGDGVQNTGDASVTAKGYDEFQHDSQNPGNMYKEGLVEGGAAGRYLRIKFPVAYPDRFVQFNEIQINGGAYTGVENNKNFEGTLEEKGHRPSYMTDRDMTTTYKPSKKNGSMTYFISEPKDINVIRFIQSGNAGNTKVSATFWDPAAKAMETNAELGMLSHMIVDFNVPAGKYLTSVTISWEDAIPEIAEILTGSFGSQAVDKTALKALLERNADEKWTDTSKAKFESAKAAAQAVYDSAYTAQTTVDSARASLQSAIDNAVEKASSEKLTALQNAINEKVSQTETVDTIEVEIYSARSYGSYELAIGNAAEALKNADNLTDFELTALTDAITEAKAALTYSRIQRELAVVEAENGRNYKEENYTVNSYKKFSDALKVLEDKINQDPQGDVRPDVYARARLDYMKPVTELVNCAALKNLLTHTFEESKYKEEGWTNYSAARKAAEEAVISGTKDSVQAAWNALEDAERKLEFSNAYVEGVMEEYGKLKGNDYTSDSFKVLEDAIAKAQADISAGTSGKNNENIEAMQDAYEALVSTVSLKAKEAEAEDYNKTDYTKDSYAALAEALKDSAELKKSGTRETIQAACDRIDSAISSLVRNADGLKDYQDGIQLENENYYTAASYGPYKDAYDALMALEVGNTAVDTFLNAQSRFENAKAQLVFAEADYSRVDAALANVPGDLSLYTENSAKALENAINAVVAGKPITEQSTVDQYASDIEEAYGALVSIAVLNTKEAEARAYDKNKYTSESWAVLEEAMQGISQLKKSGTREAIQQACDAIDRAISGLKMSQPNPPEEKPVALSAPAVTKVTTIANKTGTKVQVKFKKAPNAASYIIYRKVGSKKAVKAGTTTKTTYLDDKVYPGKKVTYYAQAISGDARKYTDSGLGSGKYINVGKSTSKVTASQKNGRVTVKWKSVKKATGYVVYRSTQKNKGYVKVKTISKKGTLSFRDTKVKKGKTYYYRVAAKVNRQYTAMKTSKSIKVRK